jgi:hypothetical protein
MRAAIITLDVGGHYLFLRVKPVSFLERQFGIQVAAYEPDEERLNSLDSIGALWIRRRDPPVHFG